MTSPERAALEDKVRSTADAVKAAEKEAVLAVLFGDYEDIARAREALLKADEQHTDALRASSVSFNGEW